ncbi:hypothetical protein HPB50_013530 [Hyalomma asiaticum]|uniref:Uncharacterized protein n=1 Tax=Hyalomma asiaticum TaxID=266040 RepID=A0ACB7RND8_HYAAI|nr:hypothetical protein HPB50_013530 [Hyalomma asiaticum]
MAVYVMHAEDLSCFYIMRKEQEQALEDLATRLEAHYAETPEPVVKPLPKLPCVVFYPQEEAWYRAKVSGDGSCVQFVDYGNSDIVPEVREIAAEFLEVPPFCYKCKLDGVKDLAGIPGTFSAFKEMIADVELELEVITWGPEVAVRLSKEGQDIATLLKSRFLSSEPEASTTDAQNEPVASAESTPATEPSPAAFMVRQACTVSHVDSLSSFYLLFSTKVDVLADFADKLQNALASTPPTVVETPDTSTLYAALYSDDGLWYRARVEGPAEEGGLKVRFVDYGNVETVKSVVSLDSEEFSVEPFCIECQLADVQDADDLNAVEIFKDLVLDADLLVETVKSEKPMTVRLFTADGVDLLSKLPLKRRYRGPEIALHQKAQVTITHVESTTDFFIQYIDRLDALETLSQQLLEVPVEENAPVDTSLPCMAYWTDDLPYRVTVLQDEGKSVVVKFVDYGNTDIVEQARIYELPDALLSEPLFAINCTLDIPEGRLGEEAVDKLKLLADTGPASSLLAEFLGERNGRYVVRLLDMGMDVLERLNEGAVQEATQGSSVDVASDYQNEPISEEGASKVPEGVPEAPVAEGADIPHGQTSMEPLPNTLAVAAPSCSTEEQDFEVQTMEEAEEAAIVVHKDEPAQGLELETCQDTLKDEAMGFTVEAESLEVDRPSDEAPHGVAPEVSQSSEACEYLPEEDALPEPECSGSSLPADYDEYVPDDPESKEGAACSEEPEPLCSVAGSVELGEEAVLPERAGVSGAASSIVHDGDTLSEVPEFCEKELPALSKDYTLPEVEHDAAVLEDTVSEDNVTPEESMGESHTIDTGTAQSTVMLTDKQPALAGSGDAHIAETVTGEAHENRPQRETGTADSKVGLTPEGSDALSSPRQASRDDSSAMGAAATSEAASLKIGAGGDGRRAVVPNGSTAHYSPVTPRRFTKRLSLDDCPIPGACTNAELLEIPSSENVN